MTDTDFRENLYVISVCDEFIKYDALMRIKLNISALIYNINMWRGQLCGYIPYVYINMRYFTRQHGTSSTGLVDSEFLSKADRCASSQFSDFLCLFLCRKINIDKVFFISEYCFII